MRKISFIILLFLSISCEKTNKKSTIEEDLIKNNESPLFMSLSPHMTDKDFDDEINSLNNSGKLTEGSFTVKVKDAVFYFRVYKDKSSIWLYADNLNNFYYTDYDEYERQIKEGYRKINDYFKKIEYKYKDKKNESLTNIFFEDWSSESGDFGVYRDSSKTVTIENRLDIDEFKSEQYIKDNYKTFSTDKNGRVVSSGHVDATIIIHYYYNEEFDKLLEEKKHNKVISEQNKIDELNKKTVQEKVLENNLNDL